MCSRVDRCSDTAVLPGRWLFWGFFCAYLAVGAFFNLLLMMLCYQQHRFAGPARNVLLCQVITCASELFSSQTEK